MTPGVGWMGYDGLLFDKPVIVIFLYVVCVCVCVWCVCVKKSTLISLYRSKTVIDSETRVWLTRDNIRGFKI